MPGRSFSSEKYRFGFNGKENDNEVKGIGNQQDYGMRIYDPRLGRFLSVDPLTKSYPWYTPFQFAGNKPIAFVDRDGEEEARVEEIAYAILNVLDASIVEANRDKAWQAAINSELPGIQDGLQDAFRHTYWNALNARDVGADNAEPFATIHETGVTNPANDPDDPRYDPVAIQMDLFNNACGRKIASLYPNATDEELAALVMQALANGELKVITNIGAPNESKIIGNSSHPSLPSGDKIVNYDNTYQEYNGTEDMKRENRMETLPNSGTGADNNDPYTKQPRDRKAKNAKYRYE